MHLINFAIPRKCFADSDLAQDVVALYKLASFGNLLPPTSAGKIQIYDFIRVFGLHIEWW